MNHGVTEVVFQHSLDASGLSESSCAYGVLIPAIGQSLFSGSFNHLGHKWCLRLFHVHGHLDVYLMRTSNTMVDTAVIISFGVRIIHGNLVHNIPPQSFEMKPDGEKWFHHSKVIRWDQLLAEFCTNGEHIDFCIGFIPSFCRPIHCSNCVFNGASRNAESAMVARERRLQGRLDCVQGI